MFVNSDNLKVRAQVLRTIRAFFDARGFVEVETPVRIPAPAPEPHIDCPASGDWFLRASPELQMKKLLAAGLPRIYQIGPCFREGERGRRHAPEFTMLEWYRADAGYMDIDPGDRCESLRRDICFTLMEMGIQPESAHHEEGPGQNEIDFHYAEPLKAAEDALTFRSVVKTVAERNGLAADFMPRPLDDEAGSGMHINFSVKSEDGEDKLNYVIDLRTSDFSDKTYVFRAVTVCDQGGVEAPVAEVLDYCSRDFTCVFVFPEENENHFPMQNLPKIPPRTSSASMLSPRMQLTEEMALRRSSARRSPGSWVSMPSRT